MKRNALPCLVLAAVMASSSVPSVYAEETVNDTVSAQGPEDAADTETPSDAPETDATGSDDNTNHGGLGKKWREWKTEIEIFSIFCIKIKNFIIRKGY